MTRNQYIKELRRILRHYGKIEKKYIHTQESGQMMTALQHEKNDALLRLSQIYHGAPK